MEMAVASTLTEAGRMEAILNLETDVYASSSKRPRASYLKTWERMHLQWFGEHVPMLPLTPLKLKGVGALFKAGRYRSISNQLSTLKSLHIETGHEWSDVLSLVSKRVERSVTRGIGPSSQCRSFDVGEVCSLDLGASPLVDKGPIGPGNLLVAGSFFMLREIEASLALWKSVTLNEAKKIITWNLPASKSDPQALGKTRTWGCTCSPEGVPSACPFHSMKAQRAAVIAELALDDNACLDSVPVFPDRWGRIVEKLAVVETYKQVARLLGVSETDLVGIGGHACRVSGAQHLAKLGFDVVLIQLMARWAGDMVLRYIAEAPLGAITETYRKLAAGRSLGDQMDELMTQVSDLKFKLDHMETAVASDLASERALVAAQTKEHDLASDWYLVNLVSRKHHLPFVDISGTVIDGKSMCGWRYKQWECTVAHRLPSTDSKEICRMCFPRYREAYRETQEEPIVDASSSDS